MKSLIFEAVDFPPRYDVGGREGHIIGLLLDEIESVPDAHDQAPMPPDSRLLLVSTAILWNRRTRATHTSAELAEGAN